MAKILEINTVADNTNAVGRLMMSIIDGLQGHGHECYVATGRGDFSRVDFKIGNQVSVYNHALWSAISDSEGRHSKQPTRHLIEYLHRIDPDVVHLHNMHGHYINVEMLFNALADWGGRVVMTMHDLWWLTGHCTHFDHNGCAPWDGDCLSCRWHRKEYPTSLIGNTAGNLRRKHQLLMSVKDLTIVVPSQWMRQQLSRSHLSGLRCVVIPNGVDTCVFHPRAAGSQREGVLCVASRWSRSKVLEYIVDFSHATDMPITVVGDLMRQRVDKSRIRVIPKASPDELARLYQSCAVLINPSQVESYGMVTAEGLSCGAPVVVNSHCGASVELISNGGGLAVDPHRFGDGVAMILSGHYPPLSIIPATGVEMCDAYERLLTVS